VKYFFALIIIVLLFFILDFFLFPNYYNDENNNDNVIDTISVLFTHGSINKSNCNDINKRLGGLLGGHVEVKIDSIIYGFDIKNKDNIHLFPKTSFNSKFSKLSYDEWIDKNKFEKITIIEFPVNCKTKQEITNIYNNYFNMTPYDYAFFGHRCTSSVYDILSKAKYFKKRNTVLCIIFNFYPRLLRFRLLYLAKKEGFKIKKFKGIDCKFWE